MVRSLSGRAHRRSRGDVRAAILLLLSEQPCNGYQIMQEIERRSDGAWRPSSGSVYPALQQLEDERLVTIETTPAGKVYKLTTPGTDYVAKHRGELGVPWQSESGGRGASDPRWDVMTLMGQIAPALQQIGRFGTAAQVADARKIISDARRALYRILAEADTDDGDDE
jgi:DNA-binding PadR family transcriptional regulator